jgi:hypothetical protein
MDQHPDTWTAETVKGGLIGFYREIAGVGLMFPRADWPIAVEYSGYPVIMLRRIAGIEFRRGLTSIKNNSEQSCRADDRAAALTYLEGCPCSGRRSGTARNPG